MIDRRRSDPGGIEVRAAPGGAIRKAPTKAVAARPSPLCLSSSEATKQTPREYNSRKKPVTEDNGKLADALATLIQNQAAFVQTQSSFLSHLEETRRDFARMEADLGQIKTILLRHDQVLAELPEVIRQKVGFNQ